MIWLSLVCTLNGQCSGICGEASYQEERLTLAERGRNGHFKNKTKPPFSLMTTVVFEPGDVIDISMWRNRKRTKDANPDLFE